MCVCVCVSDHDPDHDPDHDTVLPRASSQPNVSTAPLRKPLPPPKKYQPTPPPPTKNTHTHTHTRKKKPHATHHAIRKRQHVIARARRKTRLDEFPQHGPPARERHEAVRARGRDVGAGRGRVVGGRLACGEARGGSEGEARDDAALCAGGDEVVGGEGGGGGWGWDGDGVGEGEGEDEGESEGEDGEVHGCFVVVVVVVVLSLWGNAG